jgi:serine/threonine protein kinase
MTGRTISHYEILEKLGAGGMGEIYKARDPRLNRTVAIKALPATSTGDPDRRRRFIQEAQAASGLNHPNIITIHDILSDEGNDYMVMEFVSGQTLGELIRPGGLGIAETLLYSSQIADALAAAHAAGIIHRDLKPGNVMVTAAGRVKILDFGLAKVTVANELTEQTQTIGAAPMTVEGSILGTVSYMSPEQAQGKKVDARSDIFAFGALVYEMVTGHKAFPGDSAITTLTAILRDEVKPISDHVAGVPPELEEIIGRALRKDPAQRWQTMQEVHGVLAALRQKFESGILDASKFIPPPPLKKKMSPWAWGGMAFGLTMAFGGWWSALHRNRPHVPPAPTAVIEPAPSSPATALPKAEEKPSPLAPVPPSPAAAKKDDGTLTNETILELVQAKVAEPVILSQIRSAAKTSFQLSTPEIIRLTKGGVPSAVLEAMREAGSPTPGGVPPATPAKPAVETRTVELIAGIPLAITLMADVPNDPEPGTPLRFQVKQDFAMGKDVVIATGTVVNGEIAGIRKGILGRGGKQTFRLLDVTAVDGSKIKVRAVPGKNAEKTEANIEPPGHRDKSLLAPAGSTYLAYIDGPQTVQVKK